MNEFGTEVENKFYGKKSKISPFHRSGEKKAVDRPEFVQTLLVTLEGKIIFCDVIKFETQKFIFLC